MPHDNVTKGSFQWHEDGSNTCDNCSRPAPIEIYFEPDLHYIARTYVCGEDPIDFSHNLQIKSPDLKRFVDVIRSCTAHANFHIHRYRRFGSKRGTVEERRPLSSREDVAEAARESLMMIVPHKEHWRSIWHIKPSRGRGPR